MKNGTPRTIRNVVLASYPGAGKTSLTEALAFSTGIIPSMGSVLQGNTIGDFEPEEVHRHHSLSSALLQFEWQGNESISWIRQVWWTMGWKSNHR